MKINHEVSISVGETAENFSEAARLADEQGAVVITEQGVPRYVLVEYSAVREDRTADVEELLEVSERIIRRNREAYEVLAK